MKFNKLIDKSTELRNANVLFMDIVGYSILKGDKQAKTIAALNQIVLDILTIYPKESYFKLPTGDGMALAFLNNPDAPLLVVQKIAPKIKEAGIPLRVGMHTGPIYLVEDINQPRNLVGGGINSAQRVMDCGDTGHILSSKVFAEALSEAKEEYKRLFHYLGSFEVKHGVEIEIYNVYGKDFGNPNPPKKSPKSGEITSLSLGLYNQTPPEPNFVGKKEELTTITQWYKNPDVHIGALIGWGGVGKSALIRKWYDSLKENDIQPDGIFWWGFYRNAYLEPFLNALLKYVSQGQIDPDAIKTTWDKTERIKEYIHQRTCLIILDGLEEMQKQGTGDEIGKMIHRELAELLRYLSDTPISGLCLITTRYPLRDLDQWHGSTYKTLPLIDLSISDALAMFERRRVKGKEENIKEVIERYKGHALSLTSLSGFLNRYYDGDINRAPDVKFVLSDKERFKDVNKLLSKYAEKMEETEIVFLYIFSLFRGEITEKEFAGVFRQRIEGTEFNDVLIKMSYLDFKDLVRELVNWRLISYDEMKKSYSTHPLTKGYFESTFDREGKKLCHKRIYQYFGEIAPKEPETLEEMQPLFEQVHHGCSAGLYDEVFNEVYLEKIHRRDELFITRKLGLWETDLLLVKTFFLKEDYSSIPLVSQKIDQSFLINEAGLSLLNIGRPKEAEEPLLSAIKMYVETEYWKYASAGYQNLTDLQFRIGNLENGIKSAEEAIRLAEKAGSEDYIVYSKAYLAYIFYLLRKNKDADRLFSQADELQVKIAGHRLYRLAGIFYAEFLLSTNRTEEADEITINNLRICKRNNWPADISRCYRLLASTERIKGNYEGAEAHLKEALLLAKKVGVPYLKIEALLEAGKLNLDIGKIPEAICNSDEILLLVARTGFKIYEPSAELILSKAYLAENKLA
ncbi:MAG: hypothetical protein HY769_02685 [Candidatus Stahlbacteria bacterium]|nr:hypothetical protein [Candidatus Stahlbacteria bacterium]